MVDWVRSLPRRREDAKNRQLILLSCLGAGSEDVVQRELDCSRRECRSGSAKEWGALCADDMGEVSVVDGVEGVHAELQVV